MDAKKFENLQKSFHKVDRDKAFHFGDDKEYTDWLIKDAIRSMMEKVKKYGTSQDPSEWVNPPEYSNPSEYKDFVMIIVKYRDKYKGMAKSMDGQYDLKSKWCDDMNTAGKQIVKYIDLFRKQSKPKRMDEIKELQDKRKRVRELRNSVKDLSLN